MRPLVVARHPHLSLLAPLLLAFAALAAANPMSSTVHGDGYYTYLWARTIVFDGDLDFRRDYVLCPDPWGLANAPVASDVNYWNLGPAVFWIPILAIDHWTGGARGRTPQEVRGCIGPLAERAVYGSLFAGLLAAWLGLLIARGYASAQAAWVGAFVGALTTPLAYYATTMLSYGHAASAMACGLFLWAWDRWRRQTDSGHKLLRAWAVMGAALGFAMLMRSQNAILVVLPLTTWLRGAWHVRRAPRRLGIHVLQGLLFVACLLLVFGPQMAYWWQLMGTPFGVSQGEHYMRWGNPRIGRALFATGAGLFTWSPIFYPAFAGWVILARRRKTRAIGLGILALFAMDSYVVGAVYDWWASIGYPGRRYDLLFVPAMVGIAVTAQTVGEWAWRRRNLAVGLAAIVLFVPFSVGVAQAIARGARIDTAGTAAVKWDWVNKRIATGIWQTVGNPLAWPASIPFALRWGVHPRAWDVLGSQDLFYHDHQTLVRREHESTLRPGEAQNAEYFGGTFEASSERVAGLSARVAHPGNARILLPLHWPEAGRGCA